MKHLTRTTALLALVAIALAACSAVSADSGQPVPDTLQGSVPDTPATTAPDQQEKVPGDLPIQWRPIEQEDGLLPDGDVVGGGELVSSDGNEVIVGFWMGVDDCYGVQRIDIAETETKVSVDIAVAARSDDQVCIALAEARSVTVELLSPLGARILEVGGVPVTD